ncbi:MAG: DUF2946 domain-containing protein [Candidatus Kapaibacterium sp.]|nr:MAG: DUF2946 domain-containing protein [Candidatus Kapabacteria bacterium]
MQNALPHTTRTAPTPIWTRFVAAFALVLFCLVRTAAVVHTHPHDAEQYEHAHERDATHHSESKTEETCSLCDLLAHSPLESPSILVVEASTVSLFAHIIFPKITTPISRTTRSLADRAPPTFPALA